MKLVASFLGAGVLVAGVWFGSQALGGAAVACTSQCERVEPVEKTEVIACSSTGCERAEQEVEVLACTSPGCFRKEIEKVEGAGVLACQTANCRSEASKEAGVLACASAACFREQIEKAKDAGVLACEGNAC